AICGTARARRRYDVRCSSQTRKGRRSMPGSQQVQRGAGLRRVTQAVWHWFRVVTTHSPSRFAIVVFASLVLVTTALLSLPIATAGRTVTPLADALFTAVSAVCVTGLVSVDMTTHWSHFGEAVIFGAVNV